MVGLLGGFGVYNNVVLVLVSREGAFRSACEIVVLFTLLLSFVARHATEALSSRSSPYTMRVWCHADMAL